MTEVGTVAQLWRYPVKSFQGEPVEELAIAPGGTAGDRILAVVDPAAEKVLSAKRYADLLLASARLDGSRVVITLPDGHEHASDDAGVHAALSDVARPGRATRATTRRQGVPDGDVHRDVRREHARSSTGPVRPGTWVDLADSHWVTTTSLATIAGEHPDGQWDVRRFRPNGLIETSSEARSRLPGGGLAHLRARRGAGGGADAHHAVLDAVAGPAGARSRQGDRHHHPGREQQQPGRLRQGDQERNGPGGR